MKRFKENRFAAGANREYMQAIEKAGLSLDDLATIALEEMLKVADQMGL
jgi:predicted hydrolase (HD superfamily)